MAAPSIAQQALRLAAEGEGPAALRLVENTSDDGEAAAIHGLWQVEGRLCPRDLPGARAAFARAAALGHAAAARIHAGFVATGTGGAADWPEAVRLLDHWAPRDPLAARQAALVAAMALDEQGDPMAPFARDALADTPAVALVRDLFTAAECRFLIDVAMPRLKPATVFNERERRIMRDPVRSSEGMGFPLISEWPAVHALNRRIAAASGTVARQGESLQVLRYAPGQEYRAHVDAFVGLANQRVLTVLVYLNEEFTGGETAFPHVDLAVRGRTGDALVFSNALPDGRPDPASRHAGRPVTTGVKFLASRWIRARPAGPDEAFAPADVESG